jgi:hypothetical protein
MNFFPDPVSRQLEILRTNLPTVDPTVKANVEAVARALKAGTAEYVEPQKALFREWSKPYGYVKANGIWERAKPDPDAIQLLFDEWEHDLAGAKVSPISVEFGEPSEHDMTLEFVLDHWLPRREPILVAGMGSSGKSTLVATWCAAVSRHASTLWVSSEEQTAWVRTRHVKAGGSFDTIGTVPLTPTKRDAETGKVTATTFGIYEHLNELILQTKAHAIRPLGVVVLDAVAALVIWNRGEGANDDTSVKKLIGYLRSLAEQHDVCIVMIHHFNKGQAAAYDPSRVTGTTAWVNTPRLAFAAAKDDASETGFDNFVFVIKTNLGTQFGASFTTYPVHTLMKYSDAPDTVLCAARINGGIVWGYRDVRLMVNNGVDPDAETASARKKSFDNKVMHVVEAVRAGATTRDAITLSIAHTGCGGITTNQWQKVDGALPGRGVQVTKTAHNKYVYQVAPPDTATAQLRNDGPYIHSRTQ